MSEQTQNPQNNVSKEEANNVTTQDVTQPQDYVQRVLKTIASNNPERAKEMVSNKKNIPLKLLYVDEDENTYFVKQR